MKVRLPTIEVSDEARRALSHMYGKKRLATREEIRSELMSLIEAHWDGLELQYEKDVEADDDD